MLLQPGIRPAYSRAERLSDAMVHVIGLTLALFAVPFLLAWVILVHDETPVILAALVYGVTLLAMLGFSALYNMLDSARWQGLLQRLDHSGIYFKIAGTYTPLSLLAAAQPAGLLIGMWCTAAAGAALKLLAPHRFRWLSIALYLGMGWAVVVVDRQMLTALPPAVLACVVAGGLCYTCGVAFYIFDRLPFHFTIWHVFVLLGTAFFFGAVALMVQGPLGVGQATRSP